MAKKKNRSGRASSSRDKRKSEFSFNNLIKISSVIVFIVGLFFTSIFYGIIPNPFSPFNYLMSASFVKTDDNINFVFEGDVFSAVCANIIVASNLGGRHAVFKFDQTRNS